MGIRAKGNTSLAQVMQYGNNRYSFKLEFDHHDSTQNYYGLDKLSLNNLIQDSTYMPDMSEMPDMLDANRQERPQLSGMPGQTDQPGQPNQEGHAGDWALLGASFLVLAIGLGIAFAYKKKV